MAFNSLLFLFGFLPLALPLDALVRGARLEPRLTLLVLLSFAFYGWWDLRLLPLLVFSVAINWFAGGVFVETRSRFIVPLAIGLDLLLLALFKYLNFFADLLALVPGYTAPHFTIALPLGISFFTFQHIMYLADLRAGRADAMGLLEYALYVAFFPRVIAGPLVRANEFRAQLDELRRPALEPAEWMARGFMLLTLGLAKKVMLGDPLGPSSIRSMRPSRVAPRRPSLRPGRPRSAIPSSSTSTSPATPTWQWASLSCSGSCCRRISMRRTEVARSRISGGAGT